MQQQAVEILKEATIDVKEALRRFNNNEKLYKKCLSLFPQETTYTSLIEAIEKHDFECARKEAHTLKGISSNLGIDELTRACTEVLTELKNGTGILDTVTLEHLKSTYSRVSTAIDDSVTVMNALEE